MRFGTALWIVVLGVVFTAAAWRLSDAVKAARADAAAPARWSVSKAYTARNKVAPRAMTAWVDGAGGSELRVMCSPGFLAVYVHGDRRPNPEAGTDTATFTHRLDDGAESVGHAPVVDGVQMEIGDGDLAREMAAAAVLHFRYTPLGETALEPLDFDLRGFSAAMAQVRDVCGAL